MKDLWSLPGQGFPSFWNQKSTNDQPGSFVVGEVAPYPVIQRDQFVSEADQVKDVNEHPDQPRKEAFDV